MCLLIITLIIVLIVYVILYINLYKDTKPSKRNYYMFTSFDGSISAFAFADGGFIPPPPAKPITPLPPLPTGTVSPPLTSTSTPTGTLTPPSTITSTPLITVPPITMPPNTIPPSTPPLPSTNNAKADEAVAEINRFRATFGLAPFKYDTSKNADADACAAYDAQNGYHASMKAGKAPGSSAQCECNGIMGARCVQFYENEQKDVQNPTSSNPTCGSHSCGHWCIILGSFTSIASGTSGNFSTQNFYNGRPRCSF